MADELPSFVRSHPAIVVVMIVTTLAGLAAGLVWLPEEWPAWQRALGGLVSGAGVGFLVTATKMID